jgi:carbon monoxide dehydrogenase subunit G
VKPRVATILGVLAATGCAASAPTPPATAATAGARPSVAAPAPFPHDAVSDEVIHVEREAVIYAPIDVIWAVFDDPAAYASILPFVREVEPRGRDATGALLVGLTQGVSIASGSYTLEITKVRPYELDLNVDHRYPSMIRDGRGHVELRREAEGKTRVVYSMTVDLGDHWLLHRFKDRIFKAMTRPPYLLKNYVEGRLTPPRK